MESFTPSSNPKLAFQKMKRYKILKHRLTGQLRIFQVLVRETSRRAATEDDLVLARGVANAAESVLSSRGGLRVLARRDMEAKIKNAEFSVRRQRERRNEQIGKYFEGRR